MLVDWRWFSLTLAGGWLEYARPGHFHEAVAAYRKLIHLSTAKVEKKTTASRGSAA